MLPATQNRNPDDALVPLFKHHAVKDEAASLREGRPVFMDIEVVEIRAPGSRDFKVFPALAFARWVDNPYTGEQTKQTYAERFPIQYQQFKAQAAQTKSGTPLDYAPFLTEARRAELRAQNVYTVEQLATVEGQELKNLGPGGREMKNAATEYIVESKEIAPHKQLVAELDALKARNRVLEEDAKLIAARKAAEPQPAAAAAELDFDDMTVDQLREYIADKTGIAPTGALSHKTLKRIAQEATSKAA